MKKYYDCSINKESNSLHRSESLGPLENDMMADLGKYAPDFGWERIYDYKKADLIVTNGFYPEYILEWSVKNSIPLIKRMDGVYFLNKYKDRNYVHNIAAAQSNHVIFISEFSKNSLLNLYGFLPDNYTVILNNVDDTIFKPKEYKNNTNFTMVTSATNWKRETKRLNTIIELSKIIDKGDIIRLIGYCDIDLPKNIDKIGYISNYRQKSELISSSDVFLALFHKCAGSKVTCQAVSCELPILFTDSGGVPEIVKGNGVIVNDDNEIKFIDEVPDLDINHLYNKYKMIKRNCRYFPSLYSRNIPYRITMSKYFDVFNKYV